MRGIRGLFRRPPAPGPGEVPRSVAIILDGNGRWAAARGLPVEAGHREGTRALRRTVEARDRPRHRVADRLRVLDGELAPAAAGGRLADGDLQRDDRPRAARPRRAGRADALHRPARPGAARSCRSGWRISSARPPTATRLQLWIAFDYGGRAELADAARAMIEAGVRADEVSEDVFAVYLYAPDMPDPDLVIRTSGELRMSNFLLWQLAYCGVLLLGDALARLRRGRPARGGRRVRGPAAAVRPAMSSFWSRILISIGGNPARALARLSRRLAALRARARRGALRAARAVLDDADAAAGRARRISRRDRDAARRGARRGGLGARGPVRDARVRLRVQGLRLSRGLGRA